MEELQLNHFLSTLGQSPESDYLRLTQVRLIVMQSLNELSGELEQTRIQEAKAIRLRSSFPAASEDYLIWDSIQRTANRTIPILEQRIVIAEAHFKVIESKYTTLSDTGLTLDKCLSLISLGNNCHDHEH